MLKDKNFWIGLIVGLAVCYFYCQKMKKGPGGA